MQDGKAYNSGCNGASGVLELKVMEDQTGVPDDEVARATFRFGATYTHERHVYGCDTEDGRFYAENNLDGSKKFSDRRAFEDCELK